MIDIADEDVPPHAPLTLDELMEGLRNGTLRPTNGDIILELRDLTTRRLRARVWLGRNGVIETDGLREFCRTVTSRDWVQARVLWIAKQERLN
jgi:hypothetical protein